MNQRDQILMLQLQPQLLLRVLYREELAPEQQQYPLLLRVLSVKNSDNNKQRLYVRWRLLLNVIQPQRLLAETCLKGRWKVSTVDYC